MANLCMFYTLPGGMSVPSLASTSPNLTRMSTCCALSATLSIKSGMILELLRACLRNHEGQHGVISARSTSKGFKLGYA